MEEYRDDEYEKICMICKRPESVTGKQISMPGGISVCPDCMQKTMDQMSSSPLTMQITPEMMENMGFEQALKDMLGTGNMYSEDTDNEEDTDNQEDSDDFKEVQESGDNDSEDDSSDTESEKKRRKKKPEVHFINMADLMGGMSNQPKIKKRKPGEKKEPLIQLKDIPAPHKIKESLDEYVIGQEMAKKVISVGVYNHYKRVATEYEEGKVELEKSNMLMIGPTGSGKTYMVKTLARILNVPLAIADATSLTEAGYIGDDIESVVSKLLKAADNDVDKAENGIIFIDEIDKIAKKKNAHSRDVSGESVQQGLLKLLEGSLVEVPVGSNSKSPMVPMTTIDTKNILFICGGAFPDLEEVVKERLNNQASIGFMADLKDKYDNVNDIVRQVTTDDLRKYGMIPEFLGRLPVVFTLDGLTEDMLVEVLKEPKNAILKQYERLLEIDEVKLEFTGGAMKAIARKALEKNTGARALRSILEASMLDIMYEIPKDDNIGKVIITEDYIEGHGAPKIEMRGAYE